MERPRLSSPRGRKKGEMIWGLPRIQGFHDIAELAGTGDEASEMSVHPCLEHKPHGQGPGCLEPPTCPAPSLIQGRP